MLLQCFDLDLVLLMKCNTLLLHILFDLSNQYFLSQLALELVLSFILSFPIWATSLSRSFFNYPPFPRLQIRRLYLSNDDNSKFSTLKTFIIPLEEEDTFFNCGIPHHIDQNTVFFLSLSLGAHATWTIKEDFTPYTSRFHKEIVICPWIIFSEFAKFSLKFSSL